MDIVGIVIFSVTIILLLVAVVVLKIVSSKNQKDLLKKIKVGSYIVTIAGICGKVLAVKKHNNMVFVLLQTGDTTHRSYLTVDISSIYQILDGDIGEMLNDEIMVDSKIDTNKKEI